MARRGREYLDAKCERILAAPIASATSVGQLASLARGARLSLNCEDLRTLTDAGR